MATDDEKDLASVTYAVALIAQAPSDFAWNFSPYGKEAYHLPSQPIDSGVLAWPAKPMAEGIIGQEAEVDAQRVVEYLKYPSLFWEIATKRDMHPSEVTPEFLNGLVLNDAERFALARMHGDIKVQHEAEINGKFARVAEWKAYFRQHNEIPPQLKL